MGDVNLESLKWPVAPDGYIPNSVIRSWRRGGPDQSQMDIWDAIDLYNQLVGCSSDSEEKEEDVTTTSAFDIPYGEDEYKKVDVVKRRKREKNKERNGKRKHEEDEEENVKDKDTKEVVGRQKRADEIKGKEKDKMERIVVTKQLENIPSKTRPENQVETLDKKMNVEPLRKDVSPVDNPRNTVNLWETSSRPIMCCETEPEPLKNHREDVNLQETTAAPLQCPSLPGRRWTSSFLPRVEQLKPRVESPDSSAEGTVTAKQDNPRMISRATPHNNNSNNLENIAILAPHPIESPSATSDDPQPQPEHKPPEGPPRERPIRDEGFLLPSNNITDQAKVPLNQSVLELFRKFSVSNKYLPHLGKVSLTAELHPASKAKHSCIQTRTEGLNNSPDPPYIPPHLAQTMVPFGDPKSYKSLPEWRKTLYRLVSLKGFSSPQAARRVATQHQVKASDSSQNVYTAYTVYTAPPLQPGNQATSHQRVLQKIQMNDALEPASSDFHLVIPLASQHGFFTLKPCGSTQYGRLQFDWVRSGDNNLP